MTSPPLVSIALPCYNAERTIEMTVRSIFAQTFSDWELLALDDGSTDTTLDFLQSVHDPRVRVFSDGTNRGRCFRLNQAAQIAKGKYYARMDADDLMFPERLKKQVAFLDAVPKVDIVGAGLVSIDEQLSPLGVRFAPPVVTSPLEIFKGEVLYHPAVTGRIEWFRANPYIDGYVYSDDFALWTKAAANLKIANLAEPLIFYLEHGAFTYSKYIGRRRETRQAIRTHGPPILGHATTNILLLRRWLKDTIYAAFHFTGLWRHSFRLFNRSLSEDQTREYAELIARILSTPTARCSRDVPQRSPTQKTYAQL